MITLTSNPVANLLFYSSFFRWIWYRINSLIPPIDLPDAPLSVETISWGDAIPSTQEDIPKIIWTYWDGPVTASVQACQNSWLSNTAGFEIFRLNSRDLHDFLPDFPEIPDYIPVQLRSDLIRLSLLEQHGGVWLDFSTVLTTDINWIFSTLKIMPGDLLLFFNESEYKENRERPIVENGFIASKKNNNFIKMWRVYHQECLLSGDWNNFHRKFDNYQDLIRNFKYADGKFDYLTCFISAQRVMAENKNVSLTLMNAKDDYYFYHYSMPRKRKTFHLSNALLRSCCNKKNIPNIIKLTRIDRRFIDKQISSKCFDTNSIFGRFIEI